MVACHKAKSTENSHSVEVFDYEFLPLVIAIPAARWLDGSCFFRTAILFRLPLIFFIFPLSRDRINKVGSIRVPWMRCQLVAVLSLNLLALSLTSSRDASKRCCTNVSNGSICFHFLLGATIALIQPVAYSTITNKTLLFQKVWSIAHRVSDGGGMMGTRFGSTRSNGFISWQLGHSASTCCTANVLSGCQNLMASSRWIAPTVAWPCCRCMLFACWCRSQCSGTGSSIVAVAAMPAECGGLPYALL
jgi:hypothetical protein